MKNLTVNQVCKTLWVATLFVSLLVVGLVDFLSAAPIAEDLFKILDPLAIAMAATIIITYSGGLFDMWKHRDEKMTAGQMLTFGLILSWGGIAIRMMAVIENDPSLADHLAVWWWNIGMIISLFAGVFLISAVELTHDGNHRYYKTLGVLTGAAIACIFTFHYLHLLSF